MDLVLFTSLLSLAFVGAVTPGPNNLMIMTSSAAFGWRRSLQHLWGIAIGFGFMNAVVTLGLGQVVQQLPELLVAVKIVGAAWLLWLAYQFIRPKAASQDGEPSSGRPLRFYEAALFQWVNPKGWTFALAVASGYVGLLPSHWSRAGVVGLVFVVMALLCAGTWMMAGEALHRYLKGPQANRIFGLIMAGVIAATAVVILLS